MPNYIPQINELFYYDGQHTMRVDLWQVEMFHHIIIEHLCGMESITVMQIRSMIMSDDSFWLGLAIERREMIARYMFDSISLDQFVSKIPEGSAVFAYDGRLMRQFPINSSLIGTLDAAIAFCHSTDVAMGAQFEAVQDNIVERDKLVQQVRESVERLRAGGLNDSEIQDMLFRSEEKMYLYITSDYRLFVSSAGPDMVQKSSDVTEIRLSPLEKAVYLLFLRHPEGIKFNYLPDYREELMQIYRPMVYWRLPDEIQQSVEDVTDPLSNSINEKCARIRRVFVSLFGEYRGADFCISGRRGEAKTIRIGRELVNWGAYI